MHKLNFNNVDVVVIQKQTALERYTKRNLNLYFLDYLSQDAQNKEQLQYAHECHVKSCEVLQDSLQQLKMKYILLNLDDLKQNHIDFFKEEEPGTSGIHPKHKLVISLGGDGTLLHASHHIGADIKLLGINSCPKNSVGHLCAVEPEGIQAKLEEILIDKKENFQSVKRLKVKLSSPIHKIPLALNDILISHLHPAATSRYQISILNMKSELIANEKQLSSGLWISTAAGSTAAISSYGFHPEPLNSNTILGACREPYTERGDSLKLNKFSIDSRKEKLSIFSRMRQGLVCLDGPDFGIQFGFGETIEVSSPESASLLLIQ